VEFHSIVLPDFPTIELDFSVQDDSGRALGDIQRDNIRLYENGQRIENFFMEISQDPLQLAIVVDDSGSMNPFVRNLQRAIARFLRLLRAEDTAMIIAFSDMVRVLHSATADKQSLLGSLRGLNGHGATALYDALYTAADLLPQTGKTAILLLSDGVDQNRENTDRLSARTAVEAVTRAAQKKTPIYIIGLGEQINRQELKDFARLTGGSFYYAPSSNQLQDIYELIARNLKSDLKLKYNSLNERKDAAFRNVDVGVFLGNLSGRNAQNYFSPGHFVVETSGFGYDAKKSQKNRDVEMQVIFTDDAGIEKTGGKELIQLWINQLGR
jgi:VWFA-related protein